MVQTLVEPLDEDVIKVTIKDKPGARKAQAEDRLRAAFEILRIHTLQERRMRQLSQLLEERRSARRLHRCFRAWREFLVAARKPPAKPSGDAKIELLVKAIAEKQREMLAPKALPEKKQSSNSSSSSSSSAPLLRVNQPVAAAIKYSAPLTKSGSQQQQQHLDANAKNQVNTSELAAKAARERRAKLAEQRQKAQEDKLRELDETAKKSSKATIEAAKQALVQCDPRTRRGIIHLMREQGCRDKSLMEIPRVPSPPRFLMRMEARAEARKQRMKQTDLVRRRRREEQKKREELNRLQVEEEHRQQLIKAQKEAHQIRKEQELKRLKEIERNKRLEQLADHNYNRYLLRRYILDPLTVILEEKRQILKVADKHYEMNLTWKVFLAWKTEWINQLGNKLQLARKLYRHNLLWYNFDEWRTLTVNAKQQYQVAADFYEMNLQKRCFRKWRGLFVKIKVINHEQEAKAKKHYEKHLKKSSFQIWRKYMLIANELNESEQRRNEWRDLIKKFIPVTS